MTLIGHSLGAGAAALLAMMLQARGISNLHCYAFAPPMCCEPDLAAKCSEYVTSVVYRDDIIARCVTLSVIDTPMPCSLHSSLCWDDSSAMHLVFAAGDFGISTFTSSLQVHESLAKCYSASVHGTHTAFCSCLNEQFAYAVLPASVTACISLRSSSSLEHTSQPSLDVSR